MLPTQNQNSLYFSLSKTETCNINFSRVSAYKKNIARQSNLGSDTIYYILKTINSSCHIHVYILTEYINLELRKKIDL